MRIRAQSWQELQTSRRRSRRVIEPEDVLAAYHQGKRDFAAGRSINAPRYRDAKLDEAWQRGQVDAMRAKRTRPA